MAKYSEDERAEILAYADANGKKAAREKYGVAASSLHNWRKASGDSGSGKGGRRRPLKTTSLPEVISIPLTQHVSSATVAVVVCGVDSLADVLRVLRQ